MKFSHHEFKLIEPRNKKNTYIIENNFHQKEKRVGMINDVKFPFLGKNALQLIDASSMLCHKNTQL